MSEPKNEANYDSLNRRGYSLPILKYLTQESGKITFGTIMEKLNISKRGLFLTLNDLEKDGLIEKSKIGRNSYISITLKGRVLLESSPSQKKSVELIEEALRATVIQLEKEGIISSNWTPTDRQEFIEKLKNSINQQIDKVEKI